MGIDQEKWVNGRCVYDWDLFTFRNSAKFSSGISKKFNCETGGWKTFSQQGGDREGDNSRRRKGTRRVAPLCYLKIIRKVANCCVRCCCVTIQRNGNGRFRTKCLCTHNKYTVKHKWWAEVVIETMNFKVQSVPFKSDFAQWNLRLIACISSLCNLIISSVIIGILCGKFLRLTLFQHHRKDERLGRSIDHIHPDFMIHHCVTPLSLDSIQSDFRSNQFKSE